MFRLIHSRPYRSYGKPDGLAVRTREPGKKAAYGFDALPFSIQFTWLFAVFALAFFPVASEARRQDTTADLQARIQREKNPVKKAKLQIRLGRLEVGQAADAYNHQQIPQGQKLLSESTTVMGNAWDLLKSTGRNPAKKPDGFMQLEICLREETRALNQLRRRIFYLNRNPVDSALKTLNQMHSQVLVGLFPGAAPSPSGATVEKGKIPAYQNPGKGPPQ
ncbi:MAG TPA: hypothetical protein VGY31_05775 [Terriglobia bacterium]|nr:hypothetical protein [Terriglobia bacterium]